MSFIFRSCSLDGLSRDVTPLVRWNFEDFNAAGTLWRDEDNVDGDTCLRNIVASREIYDTNVLTISVKNTGD